MANKTAQDMFLDVRDLFNDGKYREAAELFANYDSAVSGNDSLREELNCYRIIRTRALIEEGNEKAVSADIEFLNTHYCNSVDVMDGARQLMDNLGISEMIYQLEPSLSTTVAAQAKYAKESGDLVKYLELCELHKTLPPSKVDAKIFVKPANSDKPYGFSGDTIKHCSVDSDLPNGNIFIKAELERDIIQADLFLPGPDNDGICGEGYVKISSDEGTFEAEINRHQVKNHLLISPFGVEVDLDEVNIRIFNLNQVRTDL